MKIHRLKCPEKDCNKVIEGISEKEVKAWLEQHIHYAHKKKDNQVDEVKEARADAKLNEMEGD